VLLLIGDVTLEAKAKYVVSGSRSDFPWQNTIKVEGDLREAISALKAKTERGVLVGAPTLAAALEELGLIDEYRIVVHPIISGRGRRCFMACRVRGISSFYRRSGSSPACRRSTSVATRDERGRTARFTGGCLCGSVRSSRGGVPRLRRPRSPQPSSLS
jgi:dihydrofolate reductase